MVRFSLVGSGKWLALDTQSKWKHSPNPSGVSVYVKYLYPIPCSAHSADPLRVPYAFA